MTWDPMQHALTGLARLLHESGRAAVERQLVYRDDVPVKPFCEWEKLHENARLGRMVMATFIVEHADEVRLLLQQFESAAANVGRMTPGTVEAKAWRRVYLP